MGLFDYVTYRRLFGTTVLVASIGSGVGHANPLCGKLQSGLLKKEWVFRVTLGRRSRRSQERSRHPDFGLDPHAPSGAAGECNGQHATTGHRLSLAGDDIHMSSMCTTPAVAQMADSGRMAV